MVDNDMIDCFDNYKIGSFDKAGCCDNSDRTYTISFCDNCSDMINCDTINCFDIYNVIKVNCFDSCFDMIKMINNNYDSSSDSCEDCFDNDDVKYSNTNFDMIDCDMNFDTIDCDMKSDTIE